MIAEGGDIFIKDAEGTSAVDLASSPEIEILLQNSYKRHSSIYSFVNPFNELGGTGEGTTYVISDLGDEKISMCDLENYLPKHSAKPSGVELKEIFAWLESIHLEELYEVLAEAGYDNSFAMSQQMRGPMPITEADLVAIGIGKAGHRRRILWKLEQEEVQKHKRGPSNGVLRCCSQIRDGTGGIVSIPCLKQVLSEIDLDEYLGSFLDSGYDNYEILVGQFNTKYGINNQILAKEVGVKEARAIKKILNRLANDVMVYKQPGVIFDEGKLTACELCNII